MPKDELVGYLDCEPTWETIVKNLTPNGLEIMKPDLLKIAKIADIVRRGQKTKTILVFYPDGKVIEAEPGYIVQKEAI